MALHIINIFRKGLTLLIFCLLWNFLVVGQGKLDCYEIYKQKGDEFIDSFDFDKAEFSYKAAKACEDCKGSLVIEIDSLIALSIQGRIDHAIRLYEAMKHAQIAHEMASRARVEAEYQTFLLTQEALNTTNVFRISSGAIEQADKDPTLALRLISSALLLDSTNVIANKILEDLWYDQSINYYWKAFQVDTSGIQGATFSQDGKMVLIKYDGKVEGWGIESEERVSVVEESVSENASWTNINSVCVSSDGAQALFPMGDVKLVDLNLDRRSINLKHSDSTVASFIAFSPDGQMILTADTHGWVKLWKNPMTQADISFNICTANISNIQFTPNDSSIFVGYHDGSLALFNAYSGKLIYRKDKASPRRNKVINREWLSYIGQSYGDELREGHSAAIQTSAFSPDSKYFVTGGLDSILNLWDLNTGKLLNSRIHHREKIWGVGFSPDSSLLVSVSADKSAIVWSIKEDKLQFQQRLKHEGGVMALAFSSDGSQLITGTKNNVIYLWKTRENKKGKKRKWRKTRKLEIFKKYKNKSEILRMHISFSPDDEYIIVGRSYIPNLYSSIEYPFPASKVPDLSVIRTGSWGKNPYLITVGNETSFISGIKFINDSSNSFFLVEERGYNLGFTRNQSFNKIGMRNWEIRGGRGRNSGLELIIHDSALKKIKIPNFSIFSTALSNYPGSLAFTGQSPMMLNLWDLKNQESIPHFRAQYEGVLNEIRILKKGRYAKSFFKNAETSITHYWDLNTLHLNSPIDHDKLLTKEIDKLLDTLALNLSPSKQYELEIKNSGVRLFNYKTKTALFDLPYVTENKKVNQISFVPEKEDVIVVSDSTPNLKIWHWHKEYIQPEGIENYDSLIFSNDKRYAMMSLGKKGIRLWNLQNPIKDKQGKIYPNIRLNNNTTTFDILDSYLCTGDEIGNITLWYLGESIENSKAIKNGKNRLLGVRLSGKKVDEIKAHQSNISAITMEKRHIITAADSTIKIWNWSLPKELDTSFKQLQSFKTTNGLIENLSSNAELLIGTTHTNELLAWKNWQENVTPVPLSTIDFSKINFVQRSLSNHDNNIIYQKSLSTLTGHPAAISAFVFSSDGKTLYTADVQGNLWKWEWEINSSKKMRSYIGHVSNVTHLKISDDNQHLLSGSEYGTITIHHIDQQDPIREYLIEGKLMDIAFREDGHSIVVATDQKLQVIPAYYNLQKTLNEDLIAPLTQAQMLEYRTPAKGIGDILAYEKYFDVLNDDEDFNLEFQLSTLYKNVVLDSASVMNYFREEELPLKDLKEHQERLQSRIDNSYGFLFDIYSIILPALKQAIIEEERVALGQR